MAWMQDPTSGNWFDPETQAVLPPGMNPNSASNNGFITMQGSDGLYGFNPGSNIYKPLNSDLTQDLQRSQGSGTFFDQLMMEVFPAVAMAGLGGFAAAGGAGAAGVGAEGAAAGGTAAGSGFAMPAATAETAGSLSSMGLMQTAPGVWAAPGATGLGAASAAGGATAVPASGGMAGTGEIAAAGGAAGGGSAAGTGVGGLLSNPQVLGALGGAALGGLGGGGKAGSVQTEEGIPDWLMPYAKPALDRYSTELQNYNTDPFGIMPSAMQEFQKTINGGYLTPDSNPYLQDYFRMGSERVKSTLSPSFGHMQAFGANTGYNEALSKGLGDLATTLYGGAYENERNRQQQMIGAAPGFLGQSATANFAPYQQFLSTVGGMGKKKEEPYFSNPWGSVLGGAMAGSQLGSIWK